MVRVPKADWWPAGVPKSEAEAEVQSLPSVHYDAALRTVQFPLFFSLVAGNAFAGMILISSAKVPTATITLPSPSDASVRAPSPTRPLLLSAH